jgi:3-hydroxypropanoate dehydrogenase
LKKVYDLMKFAPTSANCSPLRIVFVKTKEAKARLKPCLMDGNVEKTMTAPVTAILAQDINFYDHLPMLFPPADAKSWFVGNEALIKETAMRNSSLQGAYFIIAARACGLDCGPMSGFDQEKLNQEFFKGTSIKANFLCNLGYGDKTKVFPRSPRFNFEDVCKIA